MSVILQASTLPNGIKVRSRLEVFVRDTNLIRDANSWTSVYYLAPLIVRSDGLTQVLHELFDIPGLRQQLATGRFVLCPPEGARVSLHNLAEFTIQDVHPRIRDEELLKDVSDEIDILNDQPTSVERFQRSLQDYKLAPTEAMYAILEEAYDAVPFHKKALISWDMAPSLKVIRSALRDRALLGIAPQIIGTHSSNSTTP